MKKILFLSILIFGFATTISCEKDDSLDPRPVIVSGSFVRLEITKKRLNINDINNTSFGGELTTPGNNVVKYNLYIRRNDNFGNSYTDFKLIRTVTSFPYTLNITPAEIASTLNIPLSTIQFADNFRFYGETFDSNGVRSDYYNLSTAIQSNPAFYKQAFRFRTDVTDDSGMTFLELRDFDSYIPQ